MKHKKSSIAILVILITILILGILFFPAIKSVFAFQKAIKIKNIEYSFIHMDEYLPFKSLSKSNHPFVFPGRNNISLPKDFVFKETVYNTSSYLDSTNTQGLLVLQNDTIIYENYWRGQKEHIPHIAWSMSKSYVSALMGIAIEEGYIKSIHQTVDEYLPELKGSGFDGIKIKDVLQMSSGIKFDETYNNKKSDINKFWMHFLFGKPQIAYLKKLKNHRPPGTYNEYASINTDILAMIIAKSTNQNIADYLQEKILEPIGTEFGAYWLTDRQGIELSHAGLNICLRDFAKFGSLYLKKGNWNGKQIVPSDWIEASTHAMEEYLQPASENSSDPGIGYGYQWWIIDGDEGEIMAIGVYNQHIYINPTTNTVIVKNSANQKYLDGNNPYAWTKVAMELYRKIAHLDN